jgi:hypothetical protein
MLLNYETGAINSEMKSLGHFLPKNGLTMAGKEGALRWSRTLRGRNKT